MKTALFVGRFQPLHKGHEHAIVRAARRYHIVIGIGSTNIRNRKNPFSYELRLKMVRAVLKKHGIKARIMNVPDNESDEKWAKNILKKARFDVVVSGNTHVLRCFPGHEHEKTVMTRSSYYNGTKIRSIIRKKGKWEDRVPEEVMQVIMKK